MKLNFKLWAMTAVALFAMNSCTQEEEISNMGGEKGTPVNFEFGIGAVTKTTMNDNYETDFDENDAVGIFQVDANGTVVSNAKYVLNAENNWVAKGTAIYAQEGTSYSYYAYYPYQEDVTDYTAIPITVSADQSNGFEVNDALVANAVDVTAGSTTVELSFSHAFALVQVNLSGSEAREDAVVSLKNIMPTAKLNLSTKEAAAAEGVSTDVKMWQHATEKGIYRAIVPAQTITQGGAILDIAVAKNYRFTWSQDVDYVKGAVRVINVSIGETPQQTTITIPSSDTNIDKWGNAEVAEGEGSYGEIVTPMTSLDLSTLMSTSMTFESKGTQSAVKLTDETDYWYTRASSVTTVSYDETEGAISAVNSATTKRATWMNDSFGYHLGTQPVKQTYYKLTFDVKSTIVGNQVIAVGVRNATDTKSFRIANLNNGQRNQIAVNFTDANVNQYIGQEVIVDFSQASSTTNLNNNTFSVSEESDLNGITIYFFNNFNQEEAADPQSFTTYIKNIKIEEYSDYTE